MKKLFNYNIISTIVFVALFSACYYKLWQTDKLLKETLYTSLVRIEINDRFVEDIEFEHALNRQLKRENNKLFNNILWQLFQDTSRYWEKSK